MWRNGGCRAQADDAPEWGVSGDCVEIYDQQTGQGCHVIFCLMESNKCVRCAVRGEYFFNIIYVHVNVLEKEMNFFFVVEIFRWIAIKSKLFLC